MPANRTQKRNYLSKIADERRKWPRRQCSLVIRIAFTRTGVRQLVGVQGTIVNMSEGGAAIISRMLHVIPNHFYIVLGQMEIMLPCSRVKVAHDVLHVAFINDQPTTFIDHLARIPYPLALLDPLAANGYRSLLRYAGDAAVKYAQERQGEEQFWPAAKSAGQRDRA